MNETQFVKVFFNKSIVLNWQKFCYARQKVKSKAKHAANRPRCTLNSELKSQTKPEMHLTEWISELISCPHHIFIFAD